MVSWIPVRASECLRGAPRRHRVTLRRCLELPPRGIAAVGPPMEGIFLVVHGYNRRQIRWLPSPSFGGFQVFRDHPGGARARFSSQSMGSCLMILSQPVLARRKRRGSGPRAPALSRPCCPSAVSDVCARSVTVQVPQHRHLRASAHVHAAGGARVRAGPGPHAARGRIGRRIVPELSTPHSHRHLL